jgi:hypothetical protein
LADERLKSLREKANEGTLAAEERVEYELFVGTLDFVAALKAQARRVLSSASER